MPLYRGTAKRALIIPNRAPPPTIDAIGADLALWFDRNEGFKSSGGGIVSATSLLTVARASTAFYFDSSGVMQQAANDSLRLDHDPLTRVPLGILNEESRTNGLLHSNDVSQAAWQKNDLTVTAGQALGPDGTMSLAKLEAGTGVGTLARQISATFGSASGHSFSGYIRKGSGANQANRFALRNDTTGTMILLVDINYDTLAIAYGGGGNTSGASLVDVGGGLLRITLSFATGFSAGNSVSVYAGFGGGNINSGVFYYGGLFQLEPGAFATSYIPTAASQVTRAADSISMATSAFPFNSLAGTIKLEARAYALPTPSIFAPMWNLRAAADSSTKKIEQYLRHTMGNTRLFIRESSTNQVDIGDFDIGQIPGIAFKTAAAWELDNFGISVVGRPVLTDTAGAVPSGLDTLYLGSGGPGGAGTAPVHIRRIEYYGRRVSNGELPTLAAA